jgi:type IV fimbrial biogenesis protein FimT
MRRRTSNRGLTVIELMITVAILGILASVVVPSFGNFLAKRRVEGAASELSTDLQFARSEAVARNAEVRILFGTGCYAIYLASATAASCTQAGGASITPGAALIKSVQLESGSPVSMTRGDSLSFFTFEPVVGAASNDVNANPGVLNVTSTSGKPWSLQLRVTLQGRVKTCSPSGSGHVAGFSTNCSDT